MLHPGREEAQGYYAKPWKREGPGICLTLEGRRPRHMLNPGKEEAQGYAKPCKREKAQGYAKPW